MTSNKIGSIKARRQSKAVTHDRHVEKSGSKKQEKKRKEKKNRKRRKEKYWTGQDDDR